MAKKKSNVIPTFPIGEELVGFESLTPSQVGVSGAFTTALESALAGSPSFDPSTAAAFSPYSGEVGGALENALLVALSGKFPEEMFQTSIADPTRRAFKEETAPAIREEFAGPGTFWGTARGGKVIGQRERMETGLVEKRAGLAEGALERALRATVPALDAQQSAISLAFEDYVNQHPGTSEALAAALDYLGIPMLATYQPYEEEKPTPVAGPTYSPGNPGIYAGPTSSF